MTKPFTIPGHIDHEYKVWKQYSQSSVKTWKEIKRDDLIQVYTKMTELSKDCGIEMGRGEVCISAPLERVKFVLNHHFEDVLQTLIEERTLYKFGQQQGRVSYQLYESPSVLVSRRSFITYRGGKDVGQNYFYVNTSIDWELFVEQKEDRDKVRKCLEGEKKNVRGSLVHNSFGIQRIGNDKCKLIYLLLIDPKGLVPRSVVNWSHTIIYTRMKNIQLFCEKNPTQIS